MDKTVIRISVTSDGMLHELAERLHVSRDIAAVRWLDWRCWLAANPRTEYGDLAGVPDAAIAAGARWKGDPKKFVAALVGAGCMTDERVIPEWLDDHGRFLEDRDRKRQQRYKGSLTHTTKDSERVSADSPRTVRGLSAPKRKSETETETEKKRISEADADVLQVAPPRERPESAADPLRSALSALLEEKIFDGERGATKAAELRAGELVQALGPELEREAGEVVRRVAAGVRRNGRARKPSAIVTAVLRNRDQVRSIAAEIRASRAAEHEAATREAHGLPPGSEQLEREGRRDGRDGGASSIGEILGGIGGAA